MDSWCDLSLPELMAAFQSIKEEKESKGDEVPFGFPEWHSQFKQSLVDDEAA